MIASEILENFEIAPLDISLYLLYALEDTVGFFASNGRLLYLVYDEENRVYEGIETEYLSLRIHVEIHSIKNNASFKNGYYNIISLKKVLDDSPETVSFINLCSIHSRNRRELSFREFFYSLINIFQLPSEQAFKNAVGLYGELKFMQCVKEKYGVDISPYWHKSGSYSHYDFSNNGENLEIKSVLSPERIIPIKHDQIFNEHHCWLVVINCEKYDNGETIHELKDKLSSYEGAFCNLNFSINLAKELRRVSFVDATETRFNLLQVSMYEAEQINPFPIIPTNILDIQYRIDLSEHDALSLESMKIMIMNFMH